MSTGDKSMYNRGSAGLSGEEPQNQWKETRDLDVI